MRRPIVAQELTPEQAVARGLFPGWVRSQEWSNAVGYCANPLLAAHYGIALTTFEQWAEAQWNEIV